MRTHLLVLSVLAFGAVGCVKGQVKTAAATTLDCSEGDLTVEEKERGAFWVTGCGKGAVCQKPQAEDAEIVCAGGGPLVPPSTTAAAQ